jgi:hypothetical protein
MTREEEIDKVASTYAIDEVKDTCNPASKRGLLYAGFVDGAEWADEHPSLHVVASLMHLLRSGRIDTTTTNADVLTQLQIELKNRDKTNQSKAL